MVLWHSPESNFMGNAQAPIVYNEFKITLLKLLEHPPGTNELNDVV